MFYKVLYNANNALFVVVFCFALYLISAPFLPNIAFYTQQHVVEEKVTAIQKDIPSTNTLIIPRIGVNTPILEGKTADVLQKGIWRRPGTSTPDKGGNTVIAGHRFLYKNGGNTFYHFDKLKTGDSITVYYGAKEYNYVIDDIRIVKPTEISIEAPSTEAKLTLYTCTPLWTSKERLVVTAKLVDSR
jgi:sortase A